MIVLDRAIGRIESILSVLSLLVIVVLVLVQVFYRYVLSSGILWINELTTSLMILMVMAGSALAARRSEHTNMTMLVESLPKPLSRLISSVALLITIAFLVTIIVTSTLYALRLAGTRLVLNHAGDADAAALRHFASGWRTALI